MAIKNNVVSFKLSDAEAELLQKKVVNSGYKNKSDYFRKVVLGENENDKIDELKNQIDELEPNFAKMLEEKIIEKKALEEMEKSKQNLETENEKLKDEIEEKAKLIRLAKEGFCSIIKMYTPSAFITYADESKSEIISTEEGWNDFVNSEIDWLVKVTKKQLPEPEIEKNYRDVKTENENLNSQLEEMQVNEKKLNDYINYTKFFNDINKSIANDEYKKEYGKNFFDLKNLIKSEYYLPRELRD